MTDTDDRLIADALRNLTERYTKADHKAAAARRQAIAQEQRKDRIATQMMLLTRNDRARCAQLLGVTEIRVGNHVASSAGLSRGMAIPTEGVRQ